jgi:hypothetical protein
MWFNTRSGVGFGLYPRLLFVIDFLRFAACLPLNAAEFPTLRRRISVRIYSIVLPLLCALIVGLALPVSAQNPENVLPATTPTTGKFVFTFAVTVASTLPKNGVITCRASASVNESGSGQNIQQDAHGIATQSGGKWTCVATMPYSWTLATPTSDNVFLSYAVEMDYGLQVTAANGTATVVVPLTVNKVNQNLKSIPVPLNGSTTSEPMTATI